MASRRKSVDCMSRNGPPNSCVTQGSFEVPTGYAAPKREDFHHNQQGARSVDYTSGGYPVPTTSDNPSRRSGGKRGGGGGSDSRSRSCGPRSQNSHSRGRIARKKANGNQNPGQVNLEYPQSSTFGSSTTDLSSIVDKDVLHNLIAEKVASALLEQSNPIKLSRTNSPGNHPNGSNHITASPQSTRNKKLGKNATLNDCHFFFTVGGCKKRADCPYRHEASAQNSLVVCEKWLILKCYNMQCPNRHNDLKNERCKLQCPYLLNPGGCRREKCVFLHSVQSTKSSSSVDVPIACLVDI